MHCITPCLGSLKLLNLITYYSTAWQASNKYLCWKNQSTSCTLIELQTRRKKIANILMATNHLLFYIYLFQCQWSCGLKRGYAAADLLGLWVRIPPGTWMSVSWELCVVGRGLCVRKVIIQNSPTECGVCT